VPVAQETSGQSVSTEQASNPRVMESPAGLGGALCGALMQSATDPAYLGRVTSVSTLFTHAVAPLSYPVTGAAVATWGTAPVFAAGAALGGAGAVTGLVVTRLRRAELPR
ncbi:hypothetical protein ABZY04_41840, partial [Streptomyces sp. NPDC002922]